MDTENRQSIDQLSIDTIRTLSMDAVEKAKSGHPGTPMALAPVIYTLWQRFLKFDPDAPHWPNRDRFVLSNGHASMMLYSMLHLTGVKAVDADGNITSEPAVSLDDIKNFRQLGSRCPGHPEYGHTTGVETTTGPLGQGCGNSVGMAIAARFLAQQFNRPDFALFDYDVYAFCGDGDMMEGITSEAASLAGHLGLKNLCWLYDNNHITIEGSTELAFSEDVAARFRAYGWKVEHVGDANDTDRIAEAIERFRAHEAPTLIIVDSHIAYGSPHKQDDASAHGEALGEEEVKLTKRRYGWPEDAQFLIPDGVIENFRAQFGARGKTAREAWDKMMAAYRAAFPDLAAQWKRIEDGALPPSWDAALPQFPADPKGMATREASGKVLNAIASNYPWFIGGAGDLSPSTKTVIKNGGDFEYEKVGRNFHFGIREHAMGAIVSGLALSKLKPYGASFLVFSDYMKASIRLAALMKLNTIYVFTHDSIGLGEDGPTHQPVEQLIQLRAIPGLIVLRPADANEVTEAWRVAIRADRPVVLVFSRQALPTIDRTRYAPAAGVGCGGYILADSAEGKPEIILIATGSEISLCMTTYDELMKEGVRARVVSMPSWELFEEQNRKYRDLVLPPRIKARVSVEAASVLGWDRYVGPKGVRIGMTSFGASAPYKDLYKAFGITVENIVAAAKDQLKSNGKNRRESTESIT